jgi:hypothetical protein
MAVRRLLAVPPAVARLTDTECWRYCTLLFLLAADDLSLVSVWSPTFLIGLVGALTQFKERLTRDLFDGTCRPGDGAPGRVNGELAGLLRSSRRRARQVDAIFAAGHDLPPMLHQLWPKLALVSCWSDAGAAMFVPELKSLFATVELQAKGLLASEGCVSIPLVGREGCALAVGSHFLEFEPVADSTDQYTNSDDWRLADELAVGSRYRIVMTTEGGLYRYQLRDVIEVVGFEHECPLVRFIGKADRVGDLVGEKLAEAFVGECVKRVCAELLIEPTFTLMAPVVDARPAHYRLYLAGHGACDLDAFVAALQGRLQDELAANPYYDHAVRIGQLGPLDVRQLASAQAARNAVDDRCARLGQKLGAVKPTAFDPSLDWPAVLEPLVVGRKPSASLVQRVL